VGSVFLVALLVAASVPFLAAVARLPAAALLGDDVVALTQGSGPTSLTPDLAAALADEPYVAAVSPEVLAPAWLADGPVVVRGVDPVAFAAVEGLALPPVGPSFALAGAGLAERIGLEKGDAVVLGAFVVPKFVEAVVTDVFDAPGPARDELLLPLPAARDLAGLGGDAFHVLRVRAADGDALLAFLRASGASVHVTWRGRLVASVNSDPPGDASPLADLLLRQGRGPIPRDLLTRAVTQATNAVRVAAAGMALAVLALAFLASRATLRRTLAERADRVAVLQGLGAGPRAIRRRLMRELAPAAALAALAGVLAGYAVAALAGVANPFVAFGYAVRPPFDVALAAALFAFVLAAALLAALLEIRPWLRRRPMEAAPSPAARRPSLEEVLVP
jgi:ABC-type lipoprotein release transport system permease subunit